MTFDNTMIRNRPAYLRKFSSSTYVVKYRYCDCWTEKVHYSVLCCSKEGEAGLIATIILLASLSAVGPEHGLTMRSLCVSRSQPSSLSTRQEHYLFPSC